MSFRIRKDSDSEDYQIQERVYRDHLDKIRSSCEPDLWRYFAVDFFHDGRIETIELGHETQISLWCPNIKNLQKPGDHIYVAALFRCKFRRVIWAEYSAPFEDTCNDNSTDEGPSAFISKNLVFSHAELDSLKTEIEAAEEKHGRKYHSLVIEIGPDGEFFSLIFASLIVEAAEPLGLAALQSNPAYHFPFAG